MRKNFISESYVRDILSYDPHSGRMTWLVDRGPVRAGDMAGSNNLSRGKIYNQIKIDGVIYKSHHIAWLFSHGRWPVMDLDHIDGDGTNNRPDNLRECNPCQNNSNSKIRKNNKCGVKGVHFNKRDKRWVAMVRHNKTRLISPYYKTMEEAKNWYLAKSNELHGEFARAE